MIGIKGQGTTEYLIILAVVIVIALVVAGVLGFFPGFASGISEQESKAYWQSTHPLSITDWAIDSTDGIFTVENKTTDKIQLTDITVDGVALDLADANISAGGSHTTIADTDVTCTSGQVYQYDVTIRYDVIGGIQGKTLTGIKPISGNCP